MFFYQLPWLPEFSMEFNDFAALDMMMLGEKFGVQTEHTTQEDLEAYKYNFTSE